MARRLPLVAAQLFCAQITFGVLGHPAFAATHAAAATTVHQDGADQSRNTGKSHSPRTRGTNSLSTASPVTSPAFRFVLANFEPQRPIGLQAYLERPLATLSPRMTSMLAPPALLPNAPIAAMPTASDDQLLTLLTRVVVKSKLPELTTVPISTVEFTGIQVRESAGTFGDLPRYLQTLPGLVGGSDVQNASFVRGGNSFENLYVIDRIEVPNINHLALASSTGGLNSMLDTESIASASFSSGDLSSSFSSHISSITDIRTLELPARNATSVDMGYSGAGFRISRPIGTNKTLLFSARESVTNLFKKDVGLNGSPEFTNSFVKYTVDPSSQDHIYIDSLSGRDGLNVKPTWNDNWETNAYDTDYTGWRNTTGLVWQHTFLSDNVGTLIVSNSQNVQKMSQSDQVANDALLFRQNTSDGQTQFKYEYLGANADGTSLAMGADLRMNRLNYDTTQTQGMFTAYSASTTPVPAFQSNIKTSSLDEAAYADFTKYFTKRLVLKTGIRYEGWGLTPASVIGCNPSPVDSNGNAVPAGQICTKQSMASNKAWLPHASLSFLPVKRINLRASWSHTAQMAPYAVMLSAPGNSYLTPIHLQQYVTGATAQLSNRISVNVEGYRKVYTGYPVATLYPQVSLATVMPTITEPFTQLSMSSEGKGLAQGVEFSVKQSPWHHLFTEGNISFARARFTGSDGIYRSGMSDLPVVANVTGGINVKKFLITVRNTTTSGRPYTPLLEAQSVQQNRPIYDLTQLNVLRGSLYNRLDFAVNRELLVHGKVLRIHGGLLNALNRQNFFENDWRPRCPGCGAEAQPSMGLTPDFSMSYTF